MRAWVEAEPDLDALTSRHATGEFDQGAYFKALIDGSPQDALAALVRALDGGAQVTAVIDAIGPGKAIAEISRLAGRLRLECGREPRRNPYTSIASGIPGFDGVCPDVGGWR